ncbi:MAG: T9SS type A sorting domain-containing protein [bacterium]
MKKIILSCFVFIYIYIFTFSFVNAITSTIVGTANTNNLATEQPNGRKIVKDTNGIIHIVFSDKNNIIYTKSNSKQDTKFITPIIIASGSNLQHCALNIDSNNNLHLVWDVNEKEIYYKKCVNGIWDSNILNISNTPDDKSRFPSIVIDKNDNVYVFWEDKFYGLIHYDIFYRKYNAITENWSEITRINNSLNQKSVMVDVDVDSQNNLYVAWGEYNNGDNGEYGVNISMGKYNFKNDIWEPIILNFSNTSNWSCEPSIVVDNNDVIHLAWGDFIKETYEERILYKKCVNGIWDQKYTIIGKIPNFRSFCPSLSYDKNNNIYCTWFAGSTDTSNDTEIYCRQKKMSGEWGEIINISNSSDKSNYCPSSAKNIDEKVDIVCAENTYDDQFNVIYYSYKAETNIDKNIFYKNKISSYPNPFNPECYIPIEMSNNKSQNLNVKIKIYNILGQVVREVITNNANSSVYWDGRDNLGKEVSSGMYFYETIINNKTQNCKKMLMLK